MDNCSGEKNEPVIVFESLWISLYAKGCMCHRYSGVSNKVV